MQNKIKQAVILCAGLGTRLRPLTDNLPKAMVPVAGKPLFERHLARFKKHGVNEFFINLHYLPEAIKGYFGDGSKFGVKIIYNYEPEILGTAGGVKCFEDHLKDNFFVIYGDVFNLVEYSKMAEAFYKKNGAIGIEIVGDTDHPYDSDLVAVDKNLKFLTIYPKPHKALLKNYKSMRGVYIFNKKILKYIPAKQYYEIDHDLLPQILNVGEAFYGFESDDYIKDIGTPERYAEVVEKTKFLPYD